MLLIPAPILDMEEVEGEAGIRLILKAVLAFLGTSATPALSPSFWPLWRGLLHPGWVSQIQLQAQVPPCLEGCHLGLGISEPIMG